MKKHLLILLFLGILSGYIMAQPRSEKELYANAKKHFQNRPQKHNSPASLLKKIKEPTLVGYSSLLLPETQTEAFYIYEEEDKGFVILSADQRMPEILGYSDTNFLPKDSIPGGMKLLLASYQQMAEQLQNTSSPITEESYFNFDNLPLERTPLLDTIAWTQDYPFYDNCPEIGGNKTLVGCVATAMSSIMTYYRYPRQAKGSVQYAWNGTNLQSNFQTHTYQWNKIRGTYPYVRDGNQNFINRFLVEEAEEAAKLCYDVALSIYTAFGIQASNSYNTPQYVINALVNNFSYDPNIQILYRNYYSRNEWLSLIKKEISEGRPVLYRGGETATSGHLFIADGYDPEDRLHFDFGWGGLANGYYYVSSISPYSVGSGATGGNGFNIDQYIFIGIRPPNESSNYYSHLILNKDLSISPTQLKRDETCNISSTLTNKGTPFQGDYSLALISSQKPPILLEPNSLSLNMDYSKNFTFNKFQMPDTIPNGLYQLYVMVKDDHEKEWNIVRTSISSYNHYDIWITDDSIKMAPASTEITLQEGSIKELHPLYKGLSGDFTLTIKNGENDFLGNIGIGILNGNTYNVIAQCIGSLEKEETISYALSGILNIPQGSYTLLPLYKKGNQWQTLSGKGLDITIKETPGDLENVTLQKVNLPTMQQPIGRSGLLKGELTLVNKGAPYDQGITFAFFNQEYPNSYNISNYSTPLFIDREETLTYTFCFPHNLPEGNYKALLYKMSENEFTRLLPKEESSFYFTIVADSLLTGITTPEKEENKILLYYTEKEICIQSFLPIKEWMIFNSNGQCIRQGFTEQSDLSIDISSIQNGSYILSIKSSEEKWENQKITIQR